MPRKRLTPMIRFDNTPKHPGKKTRRTPIDPEPLLGPPEQHVCSVCKELALCISIRCYTFLCEACAEETVRVLCGARLNDGRRSACTARDAFIRTFSSDPFTRVLTDGQRAELRIEAEVKVHGCTYAECNDRCFVLH